MLSDQKEIHDKILSIFKKIFERDELDFKNISRENFEGWDSLRHIELIIEIEKNFGIRFDGSDASEMIDFSSIVHRIMAKVKLG